MRISQNPNEPDSRLNTESNNDNPSSRLITLPQGAPALTLGWSVADWVTKNLKQPNGPRQGKPFSFVKSQMNFLLWWYAVNEDGRFIYQRAVRRLAKGSGKSPFAAMLSVAEFLGPVRFDGFAHDDMNKVMDMKPWDRVIGKPVSMPWVQIVATSEFQTKNTMRVVRAVTGKGSKVQQAYNLDVGKQQLFVPPEGTLEAVASSFKTLEGAETTFCIADETEHWLPTNGGPDLMGTIADNLTKSGARFVETCNAWKPGSESIAEASYEAWLAQEEGRTLSSMDDKLGKILYDARVAPAEVELEKPEQLREALEHVYGDCYWADIQAIMGRIYDPAADPDDSRRKYLNQPVSRGDAWCTWQDWSDDRVRRPDLKVKPGEAITLGFDGSLTNDATALVGCRVSDGHVFPIRIWEPRRDKGPKRAAVDPEVVDAVLAQTFDAYDVKAFFADVAFWESYVKVTWPKEYGKRVETWARGGEIDPQPFAFDMRSAGKEWVAAAELTRNEIAEGLLTHNDDPILSRHVLNAVSRESRWGVDLKKRTPGSPDKIDAAIAMILARLARTRYLATDAKKKKRTGKVWY